VIATLAVENYRSLRSLIVSLAPLTVVTGANGAGKSSQDGADVAAALQTIRETGDADALNQAVDLAATGGVPRLDECLVDELAQLRAERVAA
jgi:predicted ATPase